MAKYFLMARFHSFCEIIIVVRVHIIFLRTRARPNEYFLRTRTSILFFGIINQKKYQQAGTGGKKENPEKIPADRSNKIKKAFSPSFYPSLL
jgi:hypothetical protein